jgi:hypothetical protein
MAVSTPDATSRPSATTSHKCRVIRRLSGSTASATWWACDPGPADAAATRRLRKKNLGRSPDRPPKYDRFREQRVEARRRRPSGNSSRWSALRLLPP